MEDGRVFEEGVSRRTLIKTAIGVGGLAAVTGGGFGFLSRAEASSGISKNWPWPYVKLDPEKTGELAYNEWYRLFCGGAVVSSIFSQLAETVGEPYKSFPVDAFIFLEGGTSGWGTICGSNAGANMVTNLIIGPRIAGSKDGMLMGSEVMQWYCDASMPVYTPKNPKIKSELPKTVSNSPLCHVSVGKWMQAAGKALSSPERKDRCARVTASVAYHVAELLNQWKDGQYETKGEIPGMLYGINAQLNCTECHGSNIPEPPKTKN